MDPDWYEAWYAEAFQALLEKNQRLETEFKIGHWPRYDFDIAKRTLTFSDRGAAKVVAEIQVVGSIQGNDWLWAWANPSLPKASVADAARVRAFAREHGIASLLQEHATRDDSEALGWELGAVMVRVTDALGAYRPPLRDGGFLYFTVKRITALG
ncbi:MAG TPA: hypothetical protein VHA35_07495 [Dongiaceae bacterium]|jgi:hypothetical protein|nr:hypothetical protein [Dongiaceae bacterium]